MAYFNRHRNPYLSCPSCFIFAPRKKNKMFNKRIKIKELLSQEPSGQQVTVMGWVKNFRNNQFVELNDGSTFRSLQVVLELGKYSDETLKHITTSASLKVSGKLLESLGKGQRVELKADKVEILGDSDPEKYPIQPKEHSLEFLREKAHLRLRTNTFRSVFRVRHALAFAIHRFFNEKGFIYLHTPIITTSDAEGAGEAFRVSTLPITNPPFKNEIADILAKKFYNSIQEVIKKENVFTLDYINERIKQVDKEFTLERLVKLRTAEIREVSKKDKFHQLNKLFQQIYTSIRGKMFTVKKTETSTRGKAYLPSFYCEKLDYSKEQSINFEFEKSKYGFLCLTLYNIKAVDKFVRLSKESQLDFSQDFFKKPTNLTVSGQLEGELGATAFGDIYTFGPTFRAENSNTKRHLAEFWMIEPEMAFYDLEDNMNLAEEFIKNIIKYAMEENKEEMRFLADRFAREENQRPQNERSKMGLMEKLEFVLNNNFERITYTEAINILKESNHNKKKKFQYEITGWGMDLQSEHEGYLVEKLNKPVILSDYPKEIKAFYMRENEDGKTVAAMDILFPGIGEIVGGSQREERLDKLEQRMKEMHIPTDELSWYLDTRRFGTVPHAGFGLGFERMVQFVTGMTNIRDVIAFPRTPGSAEF